MEVVRSDLILDVFLKIEPIGFACRFPGCGVYEKKNGR